ncbi:MAG: RdgB/HAM1 family non-canonical purine NTP pyrophosphatase [Candidatus Delongbacteria bacterium]|nr:RdgB/HAM1 family non-canonical purine NTP pyrophosphatase [Candidatus Delongbacteria bacterium]
MLSELAVATGNIDKIREIKERLVGVVGVIHWLEDYPDFVLPPETGKTLRENASIKARALWQVSRVPTLADDTGLFVDALQGRPGVFSGRYAGPDATYQENLALLLAEMKGVPVGKRQARFLTELCCIWSGGVHYLSGSCPGEILTAPQAAAGAFGYDPIFQPDGCLSPFSRMSVTEKNRISHRGLALEALHGWLLAGNIKESDND